MAITKNKISGILYKIGIALGAALIIALVLYTFFCHVSRTTEQQLIYIDTDDNIDSVYTKISTASQNNRIHGIKILSRYSHYADKIHTGAYIIKPSDRMTTLFFRLRRGEQTPINLTVPSVRSLERLSASLAAQLMLDSLDIITRLRDSTTCSRYGYDTLTIACMVIPDTYEIYWNISPDRLLDRLQSASQAFWTIARQQQAQQLGLSPIEVSTLASIVDEETANNDEKPTIAGLYYNRLQRGMLLQADPTVIFANNAYGTHRVYRKDLSVDSPYNTYRYPGLPPGPIRIPSTTGLNAVLNLQHHDYLFMCAKEDFSGTHNFATDFATHQQNAARYVKALNERGIK